MEEKRMAKQAKKQAAEEENSAENTEETEGTEEILPDVLWQKSRNQMIDKIVFLLLNGYKVQEKANAL